MGIIESVSCCSAVQHHLLVNLNFKGKIGSKVPTGRYFSPERKTETLKDIYMTSTAKYR